MGFWYSFSVKGLEPVDSWRTWGGEKEVEPGGGGRLGASRPGSGGMLRARGFGLEPVDSWGGGEGQRKRFEPVGSWRTLRGRKRSSSQLTAPGGGPPAPGRATVRGDG